MKILLIALLGIYSISSIACTDYETGTELGDDHVICKVFSARNTLVEMKSRHQNISRKEILLDVKNFIYSKSLTLSKEQREEFIIDSNSFMSLIEMQVNENDIIQLEVDMIDELDSFDASIYFQSLSEVNNMKGKTIPGGAIAYFLATVADLASSPFQFGYDLKKTWETKRSREVVSFLINY